jgi:hypothetical protein
MSHHRHCDLLILDKNIFFSPPDNYHSKFCRGMYITDKLSIPDSRALRTTRQSIFANTITTRSALCIHPPTTSPQAIKYDMLGQGTDVVKVETTTYLLGFCHLKFE